MILWMQVAFASNVLLVDASDQLGGIRIVSLPVNGTGYSGVAVLDADADGDLDLYFGNGPGQDNALLRNDGAGNFTDMAAAAGAEVGTGTTGVLAADLDNDGYPELVLAGDKSDLRTLGNMGNGTYIDVTAASGLVGARRNISAHAADIDLDGNLDVYIGASRVPQEAYINTLWRNNGNRTFTEVGAAAGVATSNGACAATFTHLDEDAAIDLLVANCGDADLQPMPFEVYRNAGDGTFLDLSESSRIWALGHFMSFAVADYDGDLRLDFFSTNVGTVDEDRDGPHVLYRANGDGTWTDAAPAMGVAEHEFGWGAVAADLDNDGWEDLYYVGRSHGVDNALSPGLLFMNNGSTFDPPEIPIDLSERWTSGLATGDLDGDGRMDLVVVVTDSPDGASPGYPVLLLNRTTNSNHWLSVRAIGSWDNRGAVGSLVFVTVAGRSQIREISAGASYKSTNSPWAHFGLGTATEAEICVRWPSGSEEGFGTQPVDRLVDVVQGQGTQATCPKPGVSEEAARTGCGCASARRGDVESLLLLALSLSVSRRRRVRG